MVLGKYQGEIKDLPSLGRIRYENIFKMYETPNRQYYYNLLQSLYINGQIDSTKIYYMPVREYLPWSIISHNAYGTIELWWLIALVNEIYNPVKQPEVGTVLKIVRPEYVETVLTEINNALR